MTTSQEPIRQPHANLDVGVRRAKARKIKRLVAGRVELAGAQVLEIGTGSGVIAASFAEDVGVDGEVWGVDVVDQRQGQQAVRFLPVTGTTLPFPDASFRLVISNHVIEHVGDAQAQRHHLDEVARVLEPGAWAYLAMPNRWAPVEPHFTLPLLSWLPERHRSAYVRLARKGSHYDCRPLSRGDLLALLDAAGLEHVDLTRQAVDVMREVESVGLAARVLLRLSPVLFPLAGPVLPTLVFLVRPRHDHPAAGQRE